MRRRHCRGRAWRRRRRRRGRRGSWTWRTCGRRGGGGASCQEAMRRLYREQDAQCSKMRLSSGVFLRQWGGMFQNASECDGFGLFSPILGELRRILDHTLGGPPLSPETQTHFGPVSAESAGSAGGCLGVGPHPCLCVWADGATMRRSGSGGRRRGRTARHWRSSGRGGGGCRCVWTGIQRTRCARDSGFLIPLRPLTAWSRTSA